MNILCIFLSKFFILFFFLYTLLHIYTYIYEYEYNINFSARRLSIRLQITIITYVLLQFSFLSYNRLELNYIKIYGLHEQERCLMLFKFAVRSPVIFYCRGYRKKRRRRVCNGRKKMALNGLKCKLIGHFEM